MAIAVKLKPAGERQIKKGHPWVYSNSIEKLNHDGKAGEVCVVFDRKTNQLLAVGLYDPYSPIRIKILEHAPIKLDLHFFKKRVEMAFQKRSPLISNETNGYRLIYGENDFLPGLIVDVYAGVGVLKLYSTIWLSYLDILKEALVNVVKLETLVLRYSRNVLKEMPGGVNDGEVVFGTLDNEDVEFLEFGVHFMANVIHGHKTGFFLDHRQNRKFVGDLSKGKRVLDVFAYAGGFSIHALAGGAREVVCTDISAPALELAKRNASLNHFPGKLKTLGGDAFEVLKTLIQQHENFDLIVIDPPSFAKGKDEIDRALRKYEELAELGAKLTAKSGILVLASCSSRVTQKQFLECHQVAFDKAGLQFHLMETTGHDIDHPITIPEAAYLKCAYYKRSC